jgi:superfamily II DNA helicase RecQ
MAADVALCAPQPSPTCKLLYVTPEQLCNNIHLQNLLAALHRRGLLARLVIDEVLA